MDIGGDELKVRGAFHQLCFQPSQAGKLHQTRKQLAGQNSLVGVNQERGDDVRSQLLSGLPCQGWCRPHHLKDHSENRKSKLRNQSFPRLANLASSSLPGGPGSRETLLLPEKIKQWQIWDEVGELWFSILTSVGVSIRAEERKSSGRSCSKEEPSWNTFSSRSSSSPVCFSLTFFTLRNGPPQETFDQRPQHYTKLLLSICLHKNTHMYLSGDHSQISRRK